MDLSLALFPGAMGDVRSTMLHEIAHVWAGDVGQGDQHGPEFAQALRAVDPSGAAAEGEGYSISGFRLAMTGFARRRGRKVLGASPARFGEVMIHRCCRAGDCSLCHGRPVAVVLADVIPPRSCMESWAGIVRGLLPDGRGCHVPDDILRAASSAGRVVSANEARRRGMAVFDVDDYLQLARR